MYYKRLIIISTAIILFSTTAFAQERKELSTGYYMTVAAYLSTGEGYATRYTKKLIAQGYAADYGFTYSKNMYFVFIKRYDDRKVAINEINSTRKNTPFKDTWVYSYKSKNTQAQVEQPAPLPPAEEQEVLEPVIETPNDNLNLVDTIADRVEDFVAPEVEPDLSRIVLFEAREARTQDPVDVEVTIFDPYANRELITMSSGEVKRVEPPMNEKNTVSVTTNTFGWRKDEVSFNFREPVTDTTNYFLRIANDTLILYFDMHRLRRGDIQPLLNVYFFPNSSIIKPVSKLQMDELLAMMNENPGMKIKLHGHTNGSAGGRYTRLAKNDSIFFKLSKVHDEVSGSAKKLSYDRANTIREYLIYHNIDAGRITVTGWGGNKMIYDENSVAAPRNIRVEVEVIEE